jgi:hypothetical protein
MHFEGVTYTLCGDFAIVPSWDMHQVMGYEGVYVMKETTVLSSLEAHSKGREALCLLFSFPHEDAGNGEQR